jgi:hypothetical protein
LPPPKDFFIRARGHSARSASSRSQDLFLGQDLEFARLDFSVPAQALVFPLVVPGRFSCQVSAPEHPSLVSVFVHWFWPPVRFPPGARRRTDFAPRNRICSSFCSLGRFRFRGEVSIFASPVHAPRASITPPARLSLAFFVILVLPFEIPPPESRPGAVFCSSLPVSDFCLRAQSRMESIVDSFYTGRFLLPLSS